MNEVLAVVLTHNTIPEPNSGCLLWTAAVNNWGYGTFQSGGKRWAAHRASWEAHRGAIPAGKFVCHKCDVPSCVNPDHLFLGAARDNTADMMRKRRHKYVLPAQPPTTKLTVDQVRAIRASPLSSGKLAKIYDITRFHIADIRGFRKWKNIGEV